MRHESGVMRHKKILSHFYIGSVFVGT